MLSKQTILQPLDSLETFEAASQLYRTARRKGLTVRKPVDCLIAAIALENRALLVHNDRDFLALASAVPHLVVYPSQLPGGPKGATRSLERPLDEGVRTRSHRSGARPI